MNFQVIPGGLLLEKIREDDTPAPDKPANEWTPEEREEYDRYCYENAEPGTEDHALKYLDISPEAVITTISTLEALKAACAKETEETGYDTGWNSLNGDNLISLFKQRRRADAERAACPNRTPNQTNIE